jgi:putative hydrolase of the HAD superfamily
VLFDLFHTLMAVELSPARVGPGTWEILGVDQAAWHEQLMEHSRERLAGEVRDPVEIIRRMAHALDPGIPMETIRQAAAGRSGRFAQALLHPPAATCGALAALKAAGKRLALVSNADVTEVAGWPQSPLAAWFDAVVFSCDVGCVKPEPEIYRLAMRRLGMSVDQCVFVGDGGCHELEGARAIGLTTVMMCGILRAIWPEKIAGRLPYADATIESLDGLLP